MSLLDTLQAPTHPDFEFNRDPEGQPEYANPVTLANHAIRLANAHVRVTGRILELNTQMAAAQEAHTKAKHLLEDFEADLMSAFPPPATERKSNKLLDSYIRRVAFEAGQREEYTARVQALRAAARELEQVEVGLECARAVQQTIKLYGEHVQTYLSFKKHEAEQSRRY